MDSNPIPVLFSSQRSFKALSLKTAVDGDATNSLIGSAGLLT
jgi:hypothetical protein